MQHRRLALLLTALLILSLVLSACGPRPQQGELAQSATSDQALVVDVPAVYIDYNEQGQATISGAALASLGALLGQDLSVLDRTPEDMQRLADAGNTVLVIEHHLDIIKSADYLIDLGPYGGDRGGELIGTGTPEDLAHNPNSFTGQYLKPILETAGTLGRVSKPPVASRNGRTPATSEPPVKSSRARSNGAKANEDAAAAAAETMAARISRESTVPAERPKTKAAQKRERQAAAPRKETASEKNLRETRERTQR